MTTTYTVPKTIPTTGDVTAEMNEWLAGIPNGAPGASIDVSFARKQFQVEGTLTLTDRSFMRFRDGGTYATTPGDGHRAHWRATDCTSLRWLNIRVVGPRPRRSEYDPDLEWQHGFDLQGVAGYDLAACVVQGVWGDGVCNERSPATGAWTRDGIVHPTCGFHGTGRQTMSFTGASVIEVGAVQITDPTLSIFDIEPNGPGWGAAGIVVDGARISDTNPAHTFSLLYVAYFGGPGSVIEGVTVQNTTQAGNSVVVVAATPPAGSRYKGITVTGNTSDVEQSAYMIFDAVDGLTLGGNSVPAAKVTITDCTEVKGG